MLAGCLILAADGSDASDSGFLWDYATPPQRRVGRPPKHDLSGWTVTDDRPEQE
jgi:hypothetical protein